MLVGKQQGRAASAWRATLAGVALSVMTPCLGQEADSGPQPVATSAADPAATLRDTGADASRRAEAASRLLAGGRTGTTALVDVLAAENDEAGKLAVLGALAGAAELGTPLPEEIEGALVTLVSSAGPTIQPSLARAMAAVQTQSAVRAMISLTAPSRPSEVRSAAGASLERVTGLLHGEDHAAWSAWFASCEFLTRAEWQELISRQQRRAAAEARAQAAALRTSLVGLYRRVYVLTPAAERGAMLAELLSSDQEEIRALGFELTSREIQSARTPGSDVVEIVRRLLKSPSASDRESAARLLNPLAPADGAVLLSDALAGETSASAAAAMLTSIAQRWPTPAARDGVLRWLDTSGPARPAAAQAAMALLRAGHMQDAESRARALAILRKFGAPRLGEASLRLMAAVGEDRDRAAIAELLSAASSDTARRWAAEALAPSAEYTDVILEAARKDAALFPAAVRALETHRRTLAGYTALAELPSLDASARTAALLQFAGGLGPTELLSAAGAVTDALLREQMLTAAVEAWEADGSLWTSTRERVVSLLMLAESRLGLSRPELALAVLDRVEQAGGDGEKIGAELNGHATALRIRALVGLGRVEEAARLDGPASAWVAGLEDVLRASPSAADGIARQILELFGDSLTEDQRHRVASAVATTGGDQEPKR